MLKACRFVYEVLRSKDIKLKLLQKYFQGCLYLKQMSE